MSIDITHGHVLLCSMVQNTGRLLRRWVGLVKGIKVYTVL